MKGNATVQKAIDNSAYKGEGLRLLVAAMGCWK